MKIVSSKMYLQGLLDGDSQVIQEIYKKIFPKVLLFVLKNSGSKEDAHEVFQETLYQIIVRAKVKGFKIESNFSGYLFICSRNIWFSMLKKSQGRVRNDSVIELIRQEDYTVENILNQERWDLFQEKINQLSDNCKNLLRDYFKKIPYTELLKKYNYTSKNVVFQRIHKCKKRLEFLVVSDQKYKEL